MYSRSPIPAFNATELEAQDLAADLIADAEPSLRIAVPLPNLAGEKCTRIAGLLDGTAYVRLLRFLPGGTLLTSGYLSPAAVAGWARSPGGSAGRWPDFDHPGLDRVLQWDLHYGDDVVAELISHVGDPSHRAGSRMSRRRQPGRGSARSPIACPGRRSTST